MIRLKNSSYVIIAIIRKPICEKRASSNFSNQMVFLISASNVVCRLLYNNWNVLKPPIQPNPS